MTENETISRMRYRVDTATHIIGKGVDGKAYEDMEMAIKALEEIQQYRAIGTVEEFREGRERQIPKKPMRIRLLETSGIHFGICPICKNPVYADLSKSFPIFRTIDFCKKAPLLSHLQIPAYTLTELFCKNYTTLQIKSGIAPSVACQIVLKSIVYIVLFCYNWTIYFTQFS